MTLPVDGPSCGSPEVINAGRPPNGAQRYRCQNAGCRRPLFQLDYCDHGRLPAVKQRSVEMARNGSGIRDTARVLGMGSGTVMKELKKKGLRSPWVTPLS